MRYDPDLFRAILQKFGRLDSRLDIIHTDGINLRPPVGLELSEKTSDHVDWLISVGILQATKDIRMRHHPDPPTLRATEAGRAWVRRACDDERWAEFLPELTELLTKDETD